jgi:hypothetical protein
MSIFSNLNLEPGLGFHCLICPISQSGLPSPRP